MCISLYLSLPLYKYIYIYIYNIGPYAFSVAAFVSTCRAGTNKHPWFCHKEQQLDFAYWSINGDKRANESETYGLLQVGKFHSFQKTGI